MSNCLDCPDPENYAAIALQLQETALQAEECLYEVETQLRRVTNPQTLLYTLSGPTAGIPVSTRTRIGLTAGTAWANSDLTQWFTPLGFPPGVWQLGATVTATATGAVTVDSIRELFVTVRGLNDPTTAADRFAAVATCTEPNNGNGVDLTVSTVAVVNELEKVEFFFRHSNAGSTVVVATGALFWGTRLSDATALRVV